MDFLDIILDRRKGGGGGGGASHWDDLEGKPFGEEKEVFGVVDVLINRVIFLADTSVTNGGYMGGISIPKFTADYINTRPTLRIVFNGDEYICECREHEVGGVCWGNFTLAGWQTEDEFCGNMPFLLTYNNGTPKVYTRSFTRHAISVEEWGRVTTITTLDERCLPDSVKNNNADMMVVYLLPASAKGEYYVHPVNIGAKQLAVRNASATGSRSLVPIESITDEEASALKGTGINIAGKYFNIQNANSGSAGNASLYLSTKAIVSSGDIVYPTWGKALTVDELNAIDPATVFVATVMRTTASSDGGTNYMWEMTTNLAWWRVNTDGTIYIRDICFGLGDAVADITGDTPTKAEFNALLASLRKAGVIAY